MRYQILQCCLFIFYASACRQIPDKAAVLQTELHHIYRLDQQYREQLSKLPATSNKARDIWRCQDFEDSVNLLRVVRILDSMGYPGKPAFDDSSGMATFMVVQHATLKMQEHYLPLFEEAAKKGQIKKSVVALMIDRVKVDEGQKQVYGTQAVPVKDPKTGFNTDEYMLAPIEEEEHVNLRRKEVGLPTIEAGAKELGVNYVPKQIH